MRILELHIKSLVSVTLNSMDRAARFFFSEKTIQGDMFGLIDGSVRDQDIQISVAWPYFKYGLAKLGLPF